MCCSKGLGFCGWEEEDGHNVGGSNQILSGKKWDCGCDIFPTFSIAVQVGFLFFVLLAMLAVSANAKLPCHKCYTQLVFQALEQKYLVESWKCEIV